MPKRAFKIFFPIALILLACGAQAADRDYTFARDVVSRAQNDLRRAADFARQGEAIKKGDQIDRYSNAQRSLSKLDRKLSEGKFDKGDLDEAIEDVKNVVEHNTLSSEDRDALQNDLRELRLLRTSKGRPY
jgi:hypothetical protein